MGNDESDGLEGVILRRVARTRAPPAGAGIRPRHLAAAGPRPPSPGARAPSSSPPPSIGNTMLIHRRRTASFQAITWPSTGLS